MALEPGARVGPYQIEQRLGTGGMGEVYKAFDTRLGRVVALKVLPPDKVADPHCKKRFLLEAKAASALNHPNIVAIYDVGTHDGVEFMAMEFVQGRTLDAVIPDDGMPLPELLHCGIQAADALAKAHEAGIIHRDLKPSNVMLTDTGAVKLLDFGLAKLSSVAATADSKSETTTMELSLSTGEGSIMGTTAYMSPEQTEGKPVDARSDIFSFGAVLYEMATGQRPFRGESQIGTLSSILRDEPVPATQTREDLPPEFGRVIARCLRKDPSRRFQHMD
jgi:serine/threonine protein kinase